MATATHTSSVPGFFTDGKARRAASWTLRLRADLGRHIAHGALVRDLRVMDDRRLDDLGIERATLGDFARARTLQA